MHMRHESIQSVFVTHMDYQIDQYTVDYDPDMKSRSDNNEQRKHISSTE